MNRTVQRVRKKGLLIAALAVLSAWFAVCSPVQAQQAATPPEPVVAVHVSELTRALESVPNGWWTTWHYFVIPESLEEALRSDGTPYVEVSDADIAAGKLLSSDGSPRYPIVISLAAEAVADNEIAPLRDYVAAGGFLFVGSSSFTRNPDGTTRGDFALAAEMGMHMSHATIQNWYESLYFAKNIDHRLASPIPSNPIAWRMPASADEIPLGTALGHSVHGVHAVFDVYASSGTTVIGSTEFGPVLTTRPYGKGTFVYHGEAQPLIGHGVYDPAMYAYLIYRNAIEWAFGTFALPIIKLSPWRYDYDAAFIVRHDFENDQDSIRSIEQSASFEYSAGAKGDYYFCTGTLRTEMSDRKTVISSLRRAVTNYGATIGSHNGGLKNPVVSLPVSDLDYWHWGPDEVLDITPAGYSSGKAYAKDSISRSFQDIEGWLAGTDNGRPGCGAAGTCPRIWASPYFNSTREGSYEILEELSVPAASKGEQKISPFPHWTLSYETAGKRFNHISLPASDWYVGSEIPGALEWGHTTATMQAAVDFYYNLGAMINLYGHLPSSDSTLMGQYVRYGVSKPRMWVTNAVGISDWWRVRSNAAVSASCSVTDNTVTARAAITGATDPGTSIEVALPHETGQTIGSISVFIDNSPASSSDYRMVGNTVRVRVGASASSASVQYTVNTADNPVPVTTGLNPASAAAGGPAFTLTVNGSNFIADSVVRWNGADRTTAFVSSTQLTAAIPAADIATEGTAAVAVFNPAPGGGASNSQTFTIISSSGGTWTQTDWSGGAGQTIWADATRFDSASSIDTSAAGQISLSSTSGALFSDTFTRTTLSPWVASMGTWSVTNGVLQGTGSANQYSYASYTPAAQWTDYTVQGRIQMPAGSFGGGLGGRVDATTGAHYGAWVYPSGSPGGSNLLKLWKFRTWTDLGAGVPMQQASLPDVGTGWHTLQLSFAGSRVRVYYDGSLLIDATDNNYDSQAPYLSGGISADWWTYSLPYTISVDDISVTGSSAYAGSGTLLSSAFDGGVGVMWRTISWDASVDSSTSICVRTRTADLSDQLASAAWSACYGASGSAITSAQKQWMQYQLEMATTDTSISPVLSEIRIGYDLGSSGAPVPVINSLTPMSAAAGGPAFTLTVAGSNFISGSVVRWNNADRTTTYLSSTQLTAEIAAADIATTGTATVTVFNPAPGGGTSNSQTFTITVVNNPVPTTTGLTPSSAAAGGPAFTLTVAGSNFISGSVVRWNNADRTTTYLSSTQLTAEIAAADIATTGTATVTVFNPAPGGGTSNSQTFTITAASGALFSDTFTRTTLSPWVASMGTWSVTNGVLQGTGSANQYSYASYTPAAQWTDYTVQGRIQMPAGSFGGGLGGRVDATTGAHYGAWVYPSGSPGGSNLLKLWKFRTWTDLGAGVPMQQASLPDVGTGWHTLQLSFAGSRVRVYYDGSLLIDATDNNYDSRAPYLSGGISADWWTWSLPYTITVDDISVTAP